MKAIDQVMVAIYTAAVGSLSIWAFSHGVEPRPILGGDHPMIFKAAAAVCILAWVHPLVYLFRGMLRRRLSNGWCPILSAGAFAILFLVLSCFGLMEGV